MFSVLRNTLILLLAPLALAECLKEAEAERILNRYVSLFQHIRPNVAEKTLTKSLDFFSDSLDFLYTPGLPGSISGTPFWSNRNQFVQGQMFAQAQRADTSTNFQFSVLQWRYGCDHIVFHWRGDGESKGDIPGSTNQEGDPVGIAGVDMMILNTNLEPKKVKTVYSEFNLGEVLFTSGQRVCFQKNNDNACTCPSSTKRFFG